MQDYKIRRISNSSFGLTIPKEIVNTFGLATCFSFSVDDNGFKCCSGVSIGVDKNKKENSMAKR